MIDDVYEIPLDCFKPKNGKGIFVAGRCLSAEHEAVASARVTAQCFSYVHAIGHASALSLNEKIDTDMIDGIDIRKILNSDGAHLD